MSTLTIASIRVPVRFRQEVGDLTPLMTSIQAHGLLHPIVITADAVLVAGARRLAACQALGWVNIPVTIIQTDHLRHAEVEENTVRKDFLPSEMVAIAEVLAPLERAQAAARMYRGTPASNFDRGRADEKIAAHVGVSKDTLRKAQAVVAAARQEPERYRLLVEKMDNSGKVDGVYQQLKQFRAATAIPPPLPSGVYDVIYADPPWQYRNNGVSGAAEAHYPTLDTASICSLPVPSA